MLGDNAFDRRGDGFIQSPLICLSFLAFLCACSCQETEPPVASSGTDAGDGQVVAQITDGIETPNDKSGFFGTGDERVAQAVGKAPNGVDRGMSRDRASHRARAMLLKLLKESGDIPQDGNILSGSSIARVWTDDKYTYALAILPLKNMPNRLNESGTPPSNPSESNVPAAASPKGGNNP